MEKINSFRVLLYSFIVLISFFLSCSNDTITNSNTTNPSPKTSTFDASFAAQWMDAAYYACVFQIGNPPKASRLYAYVTIALYESVVNGMPGNRSLAGQLNEMPAMPSAGQTIYDWPSSLTGAASVVLRGIMDTVVTLTDQRITNTKNQQIALRKSVIDSALVDRSVAYGESIGNAILAWSRTDHYIETRTMVYVVPPRSQNPAFWAPTDAPHPNPLEPFWHLIRPFAMPTSSACDVPMPVQFDSTPGSAFYNLINQVKTTGDNLTQEQMDIALYWQDKLGTGTPPGHWVSIMNQMVGLRNLKLDAAVEMYALTGIAMGDAFIACWTSKYANNLLRSKTYIQQYIPGGQNWEPFLLTPPFPSFTCGHCTESFAAAEMLTYYLGDNISFTDTTLKSLGFQNRSFTSFNVAADEAKNSRLYGGIHTQMDNDGGKTMGIKVADMVINRVKLRLF